jgi:hypothetical protein
MRGLDDDRLALDLLIRGFQISRVIRLVADLGIADRILPEAVSNVAELASASGVLPEQLLRAMRVLAAFGIFRIGSDGTVTHTPRSLLLRSDAPNSLHYGARFWTGAGSWRAWESLDAALHGKVPHEVAWGMSRFDYLRNTPDEARVFDAFMANFPDNRHSALAAAYDFSKAHLIADIGGGNGEALRRILALYPAARGIIFDRTDVVAAIPPDELADGRITTQGGSFFDSVPTDADLYLLVRVLHDWADEDASRILRLCLAAMRTGARLLVVEGLIDPDPSRGPATEYMIDMQMMAMFGNARERTEAEFRELLTGAGFDLTRVIATASPVSILEAVPRLEPQNG